MVCKILMNTYTQNTYNYLKRKGLAQKYEHSGIYCIKINNKIVYIGKSMNMLRRISQHYVGIKIKSNKKYKILAQLLQNGYNINFDVLYYSKEESYNIKFEEISNKESEYIRQYNPLLNTQIPKLEDFRKYEYKEVNSEKVYQEIVS